MSFTGSPPVGEHILSVAGLKRVTLELGNNSGAIVEPDANLDLAVPRTVMSAFANSGQVCLSLQRLYVHESIADAFLARFVAATRALKVGNPLDRDCDVGPMISDEAADRADQWIEEAVSQGATLAVGGRREGRLLWPTVITNTRPDMKVMCREAFAPLVCVITYRDFDEAVRLLGDTPYGLQAGVYTGDLRKAFRAVVGARHGRHHGERHVDLPSRSHAVRRQSHERHRQGRRPLCGRGDDEHQVRLLQPRVVG